MAYTKSAERKPVARIFVKETKLSDADCNSIVTSGKFASSGWKQLNTLGGVTYNKGRDTTDLETDQLGTVGVVVDRENSELRLTLSSNGLSELLNLNKFQLGSTGANSGLGDKEARGYSLAAEGLSFLIYDKGLDPTNETDTPDVDCDSFAWCVFNAAPVSGAGAKWDNTQNTVELTFRPLANTGTGSARGYKAWFGAFTAL